MRLVLEGGGSRAAFSSGVLLPLMEAGIPFSSVVGASTGCMVSAYFAAGQREEIEAFWRQYAPGKRIINYAHLLLPTSRPCVDLDYLVDEVMAQRLPLDRVRATAGSPTLYVTGTDVRTGELVLGRPTADNVLDWVKGAAAIPVGYSHPVEVKGHPILDGGLVDSVPYRLALPDQDPEEPILVIVTRRLQTRKPPPAWWHKILVSMLIRGPVRDLIRDQHLRHNELMDRIAQDRDRGLLRVIEPPPELPLTRLTRDADRLAEGLQMGREIGRRLAKEIS